MDVEKARNLIKELNIKHAVEGDKGYWSSSYKEEEIIKLFTENGYTEEEARKLLEEHEDQVLLPYFKGEEYFVSETPKNSEDTTTIYTIMDECDLADYYLKVFEKKLDEMYKEDPLKYIMEGTFDVADRTERLIRTIYAKKNTIFLTKHTLISQLMDRKNYTSEEAEKIIKKYQDHQILCYYNPYIDIKQYKLKDPNRGTADLVEAFQRANNYEGDGTGIWLDEDLLIYLIIEQNITENDARKAIEQNSKILETRTKPTKKEGYRIKRIEDLLINWAIECRDAQEMIEEGETGSTQATQNVQYKDIREIFKQALEQGRKTLTYKEIIQKIQEKCKINPEEADTAFWTALKTFKITPEFEKNKNQKWKDKEYWWSGPSDYFPPRPLDTIKLEDEEDHIIEHIRKQHMIEKLSQEVSEEHYKKAKQIEEDEAETKQYTVEKYTNEKTNKINKNIDEDEKDNQ